jgi:hypothetical protein
MRDYTCNGTPVAEMSTEDIHDCLTNGISINDGNGCSAEIVVTDVIERLQLELFIRENNLRQE